MLHFSKSYPTQKQTHLHLGWPEGEIDLGVVDIPLGSIPEKTSLKAFFFCIGSERTYDCACKHIKTIMKNRLKNHVPKISSKSCLMVFAYIFALHFLNKR